MTETQIPSQVPPQTPPVPPVPVPAAPSPANHPHHHWIFGLLMLAIFLMIGIFGIFAYATFFSGDEMQTRNQAELPVITDDQIKMLEDHAVEEPVEEVVIEPKTNQVYANTSFTLPGFEYPNNWHLSTNQYLNNNIPAWVLYVSDDPLFFCVACDGTPSSIKITSQRLIDLPIEDQTNEEYITSLYSNEYFIDTVITKITEDKFSVTGYWDALPTNGEFEEMYYITPTHLVSLERYGIEYTPEEDEGYAIIKSTLDISNVE